MSSKSGVYFTHVLISVPSLSGAFNSHLWPGAIYWTGQDKRTLDDGLRLGATGLHSYLGELEKVS